MKASVVINSGLLALTCCVLIAGCAEVPTTVPGQQMTGEEIKMLITQRTLECEDTARGRYWGFHPDAETATAKYTDNHGTSTLAKAKMTYTSDTVCPTWNNKDWSSHCSEFWREGDVIRAVNKKNRKDRCIGKMVDGNPYGL